jgi:integrase
MSELLLEAAMNPGMMAASTRFASPIRAEKLGCFYPRGHCCMDLHWAGKLPVPISGGGNIVAGRKMKKDRRAPWNKGMAVGPRDPFSPSDVVRIREMLADRGDARIRDLALFSLAIDTMLHASDLLSLTVKDVRQPNGALRDTLKVVTAGRGRVVRCTLSKETRRVLEKWITDSAKKPRDHLFTSLTRGNSNPLTARQLSRLVKDWAARIGLDAAAYGTESLRRTRAMYILSETGNLEAVRVLLGHTDIGSTARYLGEISQPDPLAVSRAHEI